MKKIIALVSCLVLLVGFFGWYTTVRPSNIKKACAAKYKDLSDREYKAKTGDAEKYLAGEISWEDAQNDVKSVYTGKFSDAYSGCLHQHGI